MQQTRNLPLTNWVDNNSRHQIINQAIFEEYILSKWEGRREWASRSVRRLRHYGINISPSTLVAYLSQIKKGKREASAASAFKGLFKEFGCRFGKNGMYERMDLLERIHLDDAHYIGLPANQYLHIVRRYDSVVACETNKTMFKFMESMRDLFEPSAERNIYKVDICEYLEETGETFSVYDLDLMEGIDAKSIRRMARCVAATAQDVAVVNVASCVGRLGGSYQDYRKKMPGTMTRALRSKGFDINYVYSGSYIDGIIPMHYELMAIQR